MASDAQNNDPREAIRELAYRYCFYFDTKQYHAIADLFAKDGVFDETTVGFPLLSGKDQIAAFFTGGTTNVLSYAAHYVTNHFLTELHEKEAKGICHLLFEGALRDGSRVRILGYIEDHYVRVGAKWLFGSRKLTTFAPPEGFERVGALLASGS